MGHIELLQKLDSIKKITDSINQTIETCNNEHLFNFRFLKNQRRKKLIEHFKNNKIERIYLTQRINKLDPNDYRQITEILPDNFFLTKDALFEKVNKLNNSIVIVNNNDIHVNGQTEIFDEIIKKCNTTIFCAWDWDNHHWLGLSCKLAGIVDLYFPSHNENLFQLTRFNESAAFIIPCATVQWPEKYLNDSIEYILNVSRSNSLFGMHLFYPTFTYRTAVVKTISEQYSTVGFRDSSFHKLSDEEKLNEWVSHKTHLIVPVLNDLPIRLFDAWCSGGIPLVPKSFEGALEELDIYDTDITYYDSADILNIKNQVENTIKKFDDEGQSGILRRFKYGILNHHGNRRFEKIQSICKKEYNTEYNFGC